MSSNIRVRVAPSPTGDPHVGLAYVALFNWVFAKKQGGTFVLRLEDTDQARSREGSEAAILESLRWLGMQWDEGPDLGGPYGPYRQSERQAIHAAHVKTLVEKGAAYPCFCTPERLEAMRNERRHDPLAHGYDRLCRGLSREEIVAKGSAPRVIRLKVPLAGEIQFHDAIRGAITIPNSQIDDQVLLKADGFPTYHLANVVDDHAMKISHVIRAEEWISSTPKHILLYEAFGWTPPIFAHLPILRNADRSKISKRKNPVSLSYYRRKGILPEALLNFLSLMGWSLDGEQEIFTLDEMMASFELSQIHLGGPVFDGVKLVRVNHHYLNALSPQAFAQHLRHEVFSSEALERLQPLLAERMGAFEDFIDRGGFFFTGSLAYKSLEAPKGRGAEELVGMLLDLAERIDVQDEWKDDAIEAMLTKHRSDLGWKAKEYFMTLRIVCTGRSDSPPLVPTLAVLGRDMVRFRVRDAASQVPAAPTLPA